MSIEQDFEIVLDALKWSAAFPAAQERREAGKVALSRIEAENERLRAILERIVNLPERTAQTTVLLKEARFLARQGLEKTEVPPHAGMA